ncbi:hypothetical protein [Pseudonocardia hydrocarbonoxydans]|uniref:Uncharacterized protein n=1 Tax=Pseudonocardia hydrocarbonoxydans TaxID=76726 RepID=A0A4Y3WTV8_9PSEU|nr:hypothetical protein [Pseudonocardia hydrocarbonoxydans]GEC22332.1 hypothetical protein PHY01_46150 [Pseudonocardia hydrocarbonoxydans]
MSAAPEPDHYMVSEFGEPIALRPDGCPHCEADFVSVYTSQCWRCERTFPPLTLPDAPEPGT